MSRSTPREDNHGHTRNQRERKVTQLQRDGGPPIPVREHPLEARDAGADLAAPKAIIASRRLHDRTRLAEVPSQHPLRQRVARRPRVVVVIAAVDAAVAHRGRDRIRDVHRLRQPPPTQVEPRALGNERRHEDRGDHRREGIHEHEEPPIPRPAAVAPPSSSSAAAVAFAPLPTKDQQGPERRVQEPEGPAARYQRHVPPPRRRGAQFGRERDDAPYDHPQSDPGGEAQREQLGRGARARRQHARDGIRRQPEEDERASAPCVGEGTGQEAAEEHPGEVGAGDGRASRREVPHEDVALEGIAREGVTRARDLGGVAGVGDPQREEDHVVPPPLARVAHHTTQRVWWEGSHWAGWAERHRANAVTATVGVVEIVVDGPGWSFVASIAVVVVDVVVVGNDVDAERLEPIAHLPYDDDRDGAERRRPLDSHRLGTSLRWISPCGAIWK